MLLMNQVKVIDRELERKIREDVMKLMDQRENDFLPQVTLDKIEVSSESIYGNTLVEVW